MTSTIPAVVASALSSATAAVIASATSAAHAAITSAHITNPTVIRSIESAAITSAAPRAKASASAVIEHFIQCRPKAVEPSQVDLPGTHVTLQRLFFLVGLVCMILTVVGCLMNLGSHLIWRTNIKEQKHLMRIVVLPAWFAVFEWCTIDIYAINAFMLPIAKLYEVFCVVTFFEYMIQVLVPNDTDRVRFFVTAERLDNLRNKKRVHDRGSYRWYRVQRAIVYGCFLVNFVLTVVGEILAGVICTTARPYLYYSLVAETLQFIFTLMALLTLVRVYRRFRKEYDGSHVFRRALTFKSLVFIVLHQQLILEIIRATNVVKATTYMSMADWTTGIPAFMICCEAFIFAYIYMTTLSGLGYRKTSTQAQSSASLTQPDASIGRYLLAMNFPLELFLGAWESFQTIMSLPLGRAHFDYTGGTGVAWDEAKHNSDGDETSQERCHSAPSTE